MQEIAKQIEQIIFGKISLNDKHAHNKWADIDHLLGHLLAGRDVFVTSDKDLLKRRRELQQQLEIVVETPEELIRRFE